MAGGAEFTPEEARRIADGSPLDFSTSSAVEIGDYLFVEIRWSKEANAEEDGEEAELTAVMDALERYVSPGKIECKTSPFCNKLTTWMIPELSFKLPDVKSVTLKDDVKDGVHIQVMAFEAAKLKALKADLSRKADAVKERKTEDWYSELKNASTNFKSHEEKETFNILLGCPIVNFILYGTDAEKMNASADEKGGIPEVARLAAATRGEGSFFKEHHNLLWHSVRDSNVGVFYPLWKEDDGGKFKEADVLYRKGKDIPKIIDLLSQSISINPISDRKWAYLGGALKASNRYEDAITAYMQAIRFNDRNIWAWKGVLDCCKLLDMNVNAEGLEWYLRLNALNK